MIEKSGQYLSENAQQDKLRYCQKFDLSIENCGNEDMADIRKLAGRHSIDGYLRLTRIEVPQCNGALPTFHITAVVQGAKEKLVSFVCELNEIPRHTTEHVRELYLSRNFTGLILIAGKADYYGFSDRLQQLNLGYHMSIAPSCKSVFEYPWDTDDTDKIQEISDSVSDLTTFTEEEDRRYAAKMEKISAVISRLPKEEKDNDKDDENKDETKDE